MKTKHADILLTSINASYIHASIGLRYLYANLDEIQSQALILEFTSNLRPADIVEKILQVNPRLVGFGIYIWNTEHSSKVIALLKALAPEIIIVIGGPEVTYEYEQQPVFTLCDYLIPGAADTSFAQLCRQVLYNKKPQFNLKQNNVSRKVFSTREPPLEQLKLPYEFYTDEDINNRVLYIEASRGCPFKCEFCLSSLDKTSLPFDIDALLKEMDKLYQRGGRNFKFVDRTFNLKTTTGLKILEFFLQRLDKKLFLHFEIIPDRLPEALKETIAQFPEGILQFEIGIQSFNPVVQHLISRKQDHQKTMDNMKWLRKHSRAHIHADLIFGLPGEDLASFARGFNQLYQLQPHEIQLGILKRLRGTPLIRHTQQYQLIFDSAAPYSILATDRVDFSLLQRMTRFARYWELIANSENFQHSLKILLSDQAFERFFLFSDWLFEFSGKTHEISKRKLFDYIYYGYKACFPNNPVVYLGKHSNLVQALMLDYQQADLKGKPEFYKKLC